MRPSEFYTLKAVCNIAPGEEITLDYGKSYFGSDGLKCFCDACTPATVTDDRAKSQHDPPSQPQPFTEEQPSQTRKKKIQRSKKAPRRPANVIIAFGEQSLLLVNIYPFLSITTSGMCHPTNPIHENQRVKLPVKSAFLGLQGNIYV